MEQMRNGDLLFTAVERCDVHEVERLLNRGVDKKSLDHALVAVDDTSVLNLLLQHGADMYYEGALQFTHNFRGTVLYHTINNGNIDCVRLLLQKGVDVNCRVNMCCETALMVACRVGDIRIEIVKMLLEAGADTNIQYNNTLETTLMNACNYTGCRLGIKDRVEIVKALLDAGADVNRQNYFGVTALYRATCSKHEEIVKLLLDSGARADLNGVTLLIIALGEEALIPLFIGKGFYPFYWQTSHEGFRGLYYTHANLLRREDIKLSPICIALAHDKPKIAKYLANNLFLTKYDVSCLPNDKEFSEVLRDTKNFQSAEYLEKELPRPFSLQTLSFVEVSTLLGFTPGREDRVKATGLPRIWQERLLFRHKECALDI